ncbi:MAG TPA: MFS transporter, partial [Thermopetrobacter sp.]|nr:MFS transporter [Thermopetrobacter sp.]
MEPGEGAAVSGPAPALERPVETAAPAVRTGAAVLVLLSLGHFFVDLYSGAVGALQPLLVERLNLSLAEAGILGGVFVFTSSVLQLAFGMLSDHLRTRLFAALAPLVAGVSISLLGVAPSYWLLLALVSVGGFGIAAFHPQASATVAFGTATRRGGWMAVFISAGTLGFSLGPAYFSGLLELGGAENLYWAAAPAILVSALLLMKLPAPPAAGKERSLDLSPLRRVWRPLAVLYSLVFI